MKIFVALGGFSAFLAVALGAFGAHALKNFLTPDRLAIYQTGVQYHFIHALGLLLVALLADKLGGGTLVSVSGWAMFIGIVLFSGSLYALSLSGVKVLGAITPLGGVAFLIGWVCLAVAALRA
ncbi:DUF423 domain-containing protein [Paenibacillus chartarius]|uniref:DUF423 domain-containing protein n=1 Tax=Paenibacillus chartarius TaxID=747481 RepID=A0ABV6DFE8_9BACL